MTIKQIREWRNVPAKRGQRVRVDGCPGVITGTRSGYLQVRFDGMKHSRSCHPTWRFEYEVDGQFVGFGMSERN